MAIDIDNVFGLFGFGKDKGKNKKLETDYFEDFKNTPKFKVGMFYKMIWEGNSFRDQISNFFLNSNLGDVPSGLDEAGDYVMYTRAYYWIQECNLQDKEWEEALNYYLDRELINCIKLSIKYFEEIEEFEKCAFLKRLQTYSEKQEVLNKLKET
tara:strand:+ start:101 stop:562 length:462 start_codon:yes stop_codon:yes gene_type:complete